MKSLVFFLMLVCFNNSYCKEWKNLKQYQKTTQKKHLSPSDWLKLDRKQNTLVWQNANRFNLQANKPEEYLTIIQRRDFYYWLHITLKSKGHEVLWPAMGYFISKRIRLVKTFPYSIFTSKKIKVYSKSGSKMVFNNAFKILSNLYESPTILKGNDALAWDKDLLYKEQYIWLDTIYLTIDSKTLKTINRIAKGKFLYGLVLPKQIRFKGDISKPKARYDYGLHVLRNYKKLIKQ